MSDPAYDIAIIGGGINGCGIARDAVGRGYSVYLCEQGDLGGATSSASTKLLHGGLRYLEHYEFRLVREALIEREVLWGIAPHFIWPLRFVLPHSKGMRPAWLLRLGLFIYDHLGGRKRLPGTSLVRFKSSPVGQGLRADLSLGFEYSDCWIEDNRLVVLNARDAVERGAVIQTRTRCIRAEARPGHGWRVITLNPGSGHEKTISARMIVNAAGPWANELARNVAKRPPRGRVRQVQGSHIVVPKLYDHDRCFIFQGEDGRIIFTIPYEEEFTLIGTTDRDYPGDPAKVAASEEEIAYLCRLVSAYFTTPLSPEDVFWSYSGVRPLYDDGSSAAQKATRDYVLEIDDSDDAPILSVFGGKITTYRRLAEAALRHIARALGAPARPGLSAGWTGQTPLPGGDFPPLAFAAQVDRFHRQHAFLSKEQARRLVRQYGTRAPRAIGHATTAAGLGRDFGAGLSEAEIVYLQQQEWVQTADDLLWRRSKLGLRMSEAEIASVAAFLAADKAPARSAGCAGQ